jgi:hypothetical protein
MKHLLVTTIAAVLLVGTAFTDPIHDAARNGNLAGVQAELDKGVDVNAKDTFFFMDSGDGFRIMKGPLCMRRLWKVTGKSSNY